MRAFFRKLLQFLPEELFCVALLLLVLGAILGSGGLLLAGGAIPLALFLYEGARYLLRGRAGRVAISTPDGSDQPYHPSVLFFPKGFAGYRYIMAYTPFPIGALPYPDRWEYPCISVSQDGVAWRAPGENLPLDDLTPEQVARGDYFSDPHLVYNESEHRVELTYRLSTGGVAPGGEKSIVLFRRTTSDLLGWSAREAVTCDAYPGAAFPAISPAVLRRGGAYEMFYILSPSPANRGMTLWRARSRDGLRFGRGERCRLEGAAVDPWHIDCKYEDGRYLLLTYDFTHRLMLWKSSDGGAFRYLRTILTPSHVCGSFYEWTLYRSCLLRDEDGCKVYFSAGNERERGIGLLRGKEYSSLSVVSASRERRGGDFFRDLLEKYTCHARALARKGKDAIAKRKEAGGS